MEYKYKRIYKPHHETAMKNGMIREHRYNAEIMLGRLLKSTEVVHHIDEDKFNNNFDNLMVFKTASDHTAFHRGCTPVLDSDVYWCPDKIGKFKICPCCKSNTIYYQSNKCKYCSALEQRITKRPTKSELIELINEKSFVAIGNMFNVSDNTVRKWCKSYAIPYRKKDILNIS